LFSALRTSCDNRLFDAEAVELLLPETPSWDRRLAVTLKVRREVFHRI